MNSFVLIGGLEEPNLEELVTKHGEENQIDLENGKILFINKE